MQCISDIRDSLFFQNIEYQNHTRDTYINERKKNICAIAKTPPMKKPTAIELWNLRMIIVPPMLNPNNMAADQNETKASAKDRDPITTQDMSAKIPVIAKMEYLNETNQWTRKS